MEVFLVPLGKDRHELYCEAATTEAEPDDPGPSDGLLARLKHRFKVMLAAAEQDRARRAEGKPPPAPRTLWERTKSRALAWVADAIAEQRLLWHLRHQEMARLHFPSDMTADRALGIARASLARDRDRHWFWLMVDSLLLALSVVLVLIPGPNLVGYYFAFRVVGHFLSWRGARHGLDHVQWELAPSDPLRDLRAALGLEPALRIPRLADIASRLQLDHLHTFVARIAWPGA